MHSTGRKEDSRLITGGILRGDAGSAVISRWTFSRCRRTRDATGRPTRKPDECESSIANMSASDRFPQQVFPGLRHVSGEHAMTFPIDPPFSIRERRPDRQAER